MPTFLSIDVSPRGDRSISRALSERFIEHRQRKQPDGAIIHRDLNVIGIARVGPKSITCLLLPDACKRETQESTNR